MSEPSELARLKFDNRFTRELPADPDSSVVSRQVTGACYSRVQPVKVADPALVGWSQEVADSLGLSEATCRSTEFAAVFAGNQVLPGMDPHAMCYGGHQFGHWAGQLGDGRAIVLGEAIGPDGTSSTLQLKGAGPTPYSRSADGFAVLRSSIREFLCSEAMHHLGVPTTRALSLVTTGEGVVRDMFYDGHPETEPGAVVCRVAPSFLRFGSYQIHSSRGEIDLLRDLVDFTIRHHFAHLGEPSPETYVEWFREVCRTTAEMVVHWMRVGFVHGVMNTDNMSIHGLTIDYGPYGWLEGYDPSWTPNTTDAQGRRYRFAYQGRVALWNLVQLGNALVPLIQDVEKLQDAIDEFPKTYDPGWEAMMATKLGWNAFEGEADGELVTQLLQVMQLTETDMTIFFRRLAQVPVAEGTSDIDRLAPLRDAYYQPDELTGAVEAKVAEWLKAYAARVRRDGLDDAARRERMDAVNPKYVLRNYLAQMAIDKAEDADNSLVMRLLDVLRKPYDEQPDAEEFAAKRPEWARKRRGCSMLSCSS